MVLVTIETQEVFILRSCFPFKHILLIRSFVPLICMLRLLVVEVLNPSPTPMKPNV